MKFYYKNWNFMASYLNNRHQFTEVNSFRSNPESITCGLPQGSILGPLLFIIYVNDLVNTSDIMKFVLFADDTTIFHSGSDLLEMNNIINCELVKISKWMITNKLSLNISKTHFIIFKGKRHIPVNIDIKIGNTSLEQHYCTKFLGVMLDSELTWKFHIKYVHSKVAKALGIIYKVRDCLTKTALTTLYYSLIYPYFQYCNVAWGNANKTLLHPIIIQQKRAVRLISHAAFLEHTHPLFKRLSLLKFNDINQLELLKFVYNQLNHTNILQFVPVSNIHEVNLRGRFNLRPPQRKLELSRRFVTYRGCVEWNSLPEEIKMSTNTSMFKCRVKKLLLSSY